MRGIGAEIDFGFELAAFVPGDGAGDGGFARCLFRGRGSQTLTRKPVAGSTPSVSPAIC
jgi:hypothetical protein